MALSSSPEAAATCGHLPPLGESQGGGHRIEEGRYPRHIQGQLAKHIHYVVNVFLREDLTPLGFPGGASSKEPACQCRLDMRDLGWEGPLVQGMATHSSILAWRIPWTEEPGRLQSMGLQQSQTPLKRLSTQACCLLWFGSYSPILVSA